MRGDHGGQARESTANAYQAFGAFVRKNLALFGVRDADLADLCHEVFLILYEAESPDAVEHLGAWLREVCRRVAAGYRRRPSFVRELLSSDPAVEQPERADTGAGADEQLDTFELVQRALASLDQDQRELIVLRDVGEMPLGQLANLVGHDSKTVRKRLELARRRFRAASREQTPAPPSLLGALPERRASSEWKLVLGGRLETLAVSSELRVALLGNVLITWWPRDFAAPAVEQLLELIPVILARTGPQLAQLAVLKCEKNPPDRAARLRFVEYLDALGPYLVKHATVALGAQASRAESTVRGLSMLARSRFPLRFFLNVEAASSWLCQDPSRGGTGAICPKALRLAVDHLSGCPVDDA